MVPGLVRFSFTLVYQSVGLLRGRKEKRTDVFVRCGRIERGERMGGTREPAWASK